MYLAKKMHNRYSCTHEKICNFFWKVYNFLSRGNKWVEMQSNCLCVIRKDVHNCFKCVEYVFVWLNGACQIIVDKWNYENTESNYEIPCRVLINWTIFTKEWSINQCRNEKHTNNQYFFQLNLYIETRIKF